MSDILFHYERVSPTSWAYFSSFLMLALFFKFNRVFSIRNVDLFLLIALAPGLLLVQYSYDADGISENALEIQQLGFQWLFVVGILFLIRLLIDPAMTRRPLLDPNINAAGLTFLASSILFFLMANVVTGRVAPSDMAHALPAAELKAKTQQVEEDESSADTFDTEGPGYWLIYLLPRVSTQTVIVQSEDAPPETTAEKEQQQQRIGEITTRVVAISSHILIVVGLVLIGLWHFDNLVAGIACATMYLMLPYTARWCGTPVHAVPAALLVWSIVMYRRPMVAGLLIGLASGTNYYPFFLLSLWCSFYWERGLKRFLGGFFIAIGVLIITMAFTAGSPDLFLAQLMQMFGIRWPRLAHLQGIWRFWDPAYRIPILIAFIALSISFAAWPGRKNLGVLISCTAALMVGVQFWHAHGGGMYVAWYLPLLLLTIYRPNLDDRIAATMVSESWWEQRRRARLAPSR
jgi:hypothetical protein